MPRIIEIGKKSKVSGKKVFEILAELKDFGKGRILRRNSMCKPGMAKTYYRVHDCWPQMDDELSFGRLFVEQIHLGKRIAGITEVDVWHPDYSLVAKEDEHEYPIENVPVWGESGIELLPKYLKCPPVMAEFINRRELNVKPNIYNKYLDKTKHGYDQQSLLKRKIPAVYDESGMFHFKYRVANEDDGEKPTITYDKHPIYCERLLEGIKEVDVDVDERKSA